MTKQKIIPAVSIAELKKEIGVLRIVCSTNRAGNEVYITDYRESPQIMIEISRLREISFRAGGAGTGKSADIDKYDTMHVPFQQMFVWDPDNEEIIGAYRFIAMANLVGESPTSVLFDFDTRFLKYVGPRTIELGRSFVNFDSKKARYALHNLWDGLGALIKRYPEIKYFFGKVTLYPDLLNEEIDYIFEFLEEMFPSDSTVVSKKPIGFVRDYSFSKESGYLKNRNLLKKMLTNPIPPLLKSYMEVSDTMKYYGAAENPHFGNVNECSILISIDDINQKVKDEHMRQLM